VTQKNSKQQIIEEEMKCENLHGKNNGVQGGAMKDRK